MANPPSQPAVPATKPADSQSAGTNARIDSKLKASLVYIYEVIRAAEAIDSAPKHSISGFRRLGHRDLYIFRLAISGVICGASIVAVSVLGIQYFPQGDSSYETWETCNGVLVLMRMVSRSNTNQQPFFAWGNFHPEKNDCGDEPTQHRIQQPWQAPLDLLMWIGIGGFLMVGVALFSGLWILSSRKQAATGTVKEVKEEKMMKKEEEKMKKEEEEKKKEEEKMKKEEEEEKKKEEEVGREVGVFE